jgi:hypothetical protein
LAIARNKISTYNQDEYQYPVFTVLYFQQYLKIDIDILVSLSGRTGEFEEIADAIIFMALEPSKYIDG